MPGRVVVPASGCHGNGAAHCCWVDGAVCPFLETDTVAGRHWVCGLRRQLGSWDRVHADARYLAVLQPMFDRIGGNCGTFGPAQAQCCYAGVS